MFDHRRPNKCYNVTSCTLCSDSSIAIERTPSQVLICDVWPQKSSEVRARTIHCWRLTSPILTLAFSDETRLFAGLCQSQALLATPDTGPNDVDTEGLYWLQPNRRALAKGGPQWVDYERCAGSIESDRWWWQPMWWASTLYYLCQCTSTVPLSKLIHHPILNTCEQTLRLPTVRAFQATFTTGKYQDWCTICLWQIQNRITTPLNISQELGQKFMPLYS